MVELEAQHGTRNHAGIRNVGRGLQTPDSGESGDERKERLPREAAKPDATDCAGGYRAENFFPPKRNRVSRPVVHGRRKNGNVHFRSGSQSGPHLVGNRNDGRIPATTAVRAAAGSRSPAAGPPNMAAIVPRRNNRVSARGMRAAGEPWRDRGAGSANAGCSAAATCRPDLLDRKYNGDQHHALDEGSGKAVHDLDRGTVGEHKSRSEADRTIGRFGGRLDRNPRDRANGPIFAKSSYGNSTAGTSSSSTGQVVMAQPTARSSEARACSRRARRR